MRDINILGTQIAPHTARKMALGCTFESSLNFNQVGRVIMANSKNVFGHFRFRIFVIIGLLLFLSPYTQAQERLCDTAYEDCRQPLWDLIDAETVGIDVAFWFMQDTSFCNKIIARHNAGVPVRVLMDPRANPSYSGNEAILN